MNNIKIKIKCAYCGDEKKRDLEPSSKSDARLVNLLIKDDVILCEKCANNSEARIWLSDYILNKHCIERKLEKRKRKGKITKR